VTLQVFNVHGQQVMKLADGEFDAGEHIVRFAPDGLAGGIYFYSLTAGRFRQTRKAILLQ